MNTAFTIPVLLASFLFFAVPGVALSNQHVSGTVPGAFPGVQGTVPGATPSSFGLLNPLRAKSISQFIEQILQAVLIIGIPIAALFLVYAGFKFVTALGNPGSLTIAKDNLSYTIIGIALFLGAWLIARVIYNTIMQLGADTGAPPLPLL